MERDDIVAAMRYVDGGGAVTGIRPVDDAADLPLLPEEVSRVVVAMEEALLVRRLLSSNHLDRAQPERRLSRPWRRLDFSRVDPGEVGADAGCLTPLDVVDP